MAVTTRRGAGTGGTGSQTPAPAPAPGQPPALPAPNPAQTQRPNPAPHPAQPPPRAPIFALSPALATRGVIDYNTRTGERIYASATKELDEKRYDGEAHGLTAFLELLGERAANFGWDRTILRIPTEGGASKNLLSEYGTIPLAQIRTYEESYIDTPTRDAQDTNLLYECIMNSISTECKAKLTIWKDAYRTRQLPSGNLLLKVLIRECHLDTNATVGGIRNRLSALDTYLPTVGYNISQFNMYVKNLVDQLRARGEYTNDLLINLFKGYMAATDKAFTAYIEKKLEAYEEGQHITADQLMLWARNKYDLLRDKGTWNAPTDEEEKIIALQAQVKAMAKQLNQTKEKGQSNPKSSAKKSNKKAAQKKKEKPEWFTTKPKDLHKKVKWNNREWQWCGKDTGGHCECFVIHSPAECKGLKRKPPKTTTTKLKKPKVKVEQAVTQDLATAEDEQDDGFLS